MSETCQRCGEVGEDRRTLWMACFYAMEELGIPFERVAIRGGMEKMVGERPSAFIGVSLPVWEPVDGTKELHPMYLLRVCKDCRADWMVSIKSWFSTPRVTIDTGTGVYVRKNGAVREATEEEIRKMREETP